MQFVKDPQGEKKIVALNKKQPDNMSRGVLGCSKQDGFIYNNQVVCGV